LIENPKEKKHQRIQERKMNVLRDVDWNHVYRDWRFLTLGFVVLVAVGTYLLTGNLTWRPHGYWRWSVSEKVDQHAADLPPVAHP
jgi:hypothetical protein